jgi:integrase
MVANWSTGKRRFDSYAEESLALDAADRLARQMSERDVLSASMTRDQSVEYAQAVQALTPHNVTVSAAANATSEWLKVLGNLEAIGLAVADYRKNHRQITKKRVGEIADLKTVKGSRGASAVYLADLDYRLDRFAQDFKCDIGDVTTDQLQTWIDALKLSTQSYKNFRAVLFTLFRFAEARGFCASNPVSGVEQIQIKNGGDIEIFTVGEATRLLAAASKDFLPGLAIGLFAGLRSAEIVRLAWADVDLQAGHIVVGKDKSKTASRRIVPIQPNLSEWLKPYAKVRGKVWPWPAFKFYDHQELCAAATAVVADQERGIAAVEPVAWKQNGMRHSFVSYRFSVTANANQTAAEAGNSASIVHRHYRELVKPADAQAYFAIRPEAPENVVSLASAADRLKFV